MLTLTLHDTTMKGPVRYVTSELKIDHEPNEAELWLLAKEVITTRMSTNLLVDDPDDNWDNDDIEVFTKKFESTEKRYDVHPCNEVLPR